MIIIDHGIMNIHHDYDMIVKNHPHDRDGSSLIIMDHSMIIMHYRHDHLHDHHG